VNHAREEILARLRAASSTAPAPTVPLSTPARPSPTTWRERAVRFAAQARAAQATVAEVATTDEVRGAVSAYLVEAGLAPEVVIGAAVPGLHAGVTPGLRCEGRALRPDGDALVTGCLAAVAEEGVVVLASGPEHAAESAFLAATHILVVEAGQLLDSLEELWGLLRRGARPRMLNVVRGPSRTADLGVPSKLGAHGPLRVHVVLLAGPG
jgi:L-lactate utilization protein LutC